MSFGVGRKGLMGLIKQGWNEIPEVMGAACMAVIGVTVIGVRLYNYCQIEGTQHKKYKMQYVVYRPEHPYVKFLYNRDTPEERQRHEDDLKPYKCSPYN